MENETRKCSHDACSCAVKGDSDYCSPQCESASAGNLTSMACECGHPGCAQGM